MARPGYTSSPCPGCGSTDGRRKDQVCTECQTLLAEARETRAARHADHVQEVYIGREVHYGYAGFYGYPLSSDTREELSKALFDVIELSTEEPAKDDPRCTRGRDEPRFESLLDSLHGTSSEWSVWRLAAPEVRYSLNRLDQAIRAALADTHRAGLAEGRSVVVGLAKTNISIDSLNRHQL